MHNVDLPTMSIKFRHAKEFLVTVPESCDGMGHKFDIVGDRDSFGIVDERQEGDKRFIVILAKRPFGQAVLNSSFYDKEGHGTNVSSYYINAVPCESKGSHRIEQGDEFEYKAKDKIKHQPKADDKKDNEAEPKKV